MLTTKDFLSQDAHRTAIVKHYRCDENAVVDSLLSTLDFSATDKFKIWREAKALVDYIRLDSKGQGGIDALLHEFSLSSDEGVVLMCMAEALLRIPDRSTQDQLIKDKLLKGNWGGHLGNSDSLFVNASSWGLLLTGKVVSYRHAKQQDQMTLLKKAVGRLGEPVIRRSVNVAMRIMGRQFVTGKTIDEALSRSHEKAHRDYRFSFDMLGEAARTMGDAEAYYQSYLNAIHAIGKDAKGLGSEASHGISVKLSALHPRYELHQRDRVMNELVPKLKALALVAKDYDIGFTVDAEEADRLDMSLDIIEAVFLDPDLGSWDGFGLAVQAYQRRATFVLDWLLALTQKANKRMMVRLVKGAYWDTEIKLAQQGGLSDFPVFTRKQSTDASYLACAKKLLAARDYFYPQFATHNALTVASILNMAGEKKDGFEFQRLHGMGESLFAKVCQDTKLPCRVYAPVGIHEDLLAYLVRRLLENGANSSFVNAILDEEKPLETLLADPVDILKAMDDKTHRLIAKPADLFGDERQNSQGVDTSDLFELDRLTRSLTTHEAKWLDSAQAAEGHLVRNPADLTEVIGSYELMQSSEMEQAVDKAQQAFMDWSAETPEARAEVLIKLADLLETHRDELMMLCIKEAGKVLQDAIDEVREAVDFCRYYAHQACHGSYAGQPARGVVLCISPWNFPLAIYLGQVAAAIVMGNTVLAKPAEQTALIARFTLDLLKQAGMPDDVVQLLLASGQEVGDVVVPHQAVQAVMFTGSTNTGLRIARTLAKRPEAQVPLIAETGGQNCMIVDSTALLEQVVDDVIGSGFQSAGQRCSALRVLFVQEDVADHLIELITGAMKELKVADPKWLSTDIGPVIDQKAFDNLSSHVNYLEGKAKLLYECEVTPTSDSHYFFAPRLYEIDSIDTLKEEVFGPIVHLVRFKASDIDKVIDDINSTGFGLTMGIHTRIDERASALAAASNAGNIYINRNMIGAVVGVQPFGGHGLSGTGPKAGGPHYLGRLVRDVASTERLPDQHKLDHEAQPISDIDALFTQSEAVLDEWKHTSIEERVVTVRHLASLIATSSMATQQHLDVDKTLGQLNDQLLQLKKTFSKPVMLKGPTGESNSLHHSGRGCILNYANIETSFVDWITSLLTAVTLGNTCITIVSDVVYDEAKTLFEAFNKETGLSLIQLAKGDDLVAILTHKQLEGVIVSSECRVSQTITALLAARDGAILPMINARSSRLADALVLEKTISIDTTASGGNAALMAMDE